MSNQSLFTILYFTQRTHGVIITSLLCQNDVVKRNSDAIVAACVHWGLGLFTTKSSPADLCCVLFVYLLCCFFVCFFVVVFFFFLGGGGGGGGGGVLLVLFLFLLWFVCFVNFFISVYWCIDVYTMFYCWSCYIMVSRNHRVTNCHFEYLDFFYSRFCIYGMA